ncbi:MAG: hypothetical protein HFJ21_02830 [Clostridia bacterium]|jgi:hypothetical protein|nr:hypothetical protein [Clostridia bacterium]MCI9459383.1 hypothetical protein [Clostridia bacterium]
MLLNGLQPHVVGILIAVVVLQYAFAIFCLMKLAYLDVTKKEYVLWNLLILLVFFIGGGAFLVYHHKVKEYRSIKPSESNTYDRKARLKDQFACTTHKPDAEPTAETERPETPDAERTESADAEQAEAPDKE